MFNFSNDSFPTLRLDDFVYFYTNRICATRVWLLSRNTTFRFTKDLYFALFFVSLHYFCTLLTTGATINEI